MEPPALGPGTNLALLLTLVAALVPLIGLLISKENKVSEFRRDWINSLRKEIAKSIGRLNAVQGTLRRLGVSEQGWQEARGDLIGANTCISMIKLRLNPNELQSQKVIKLLGDLEAHFNQTVPAGRIPDTAKFNDIERQLLAESQVLLKSEWNRVRDGEPIFVGFRLAFGIAAAVFALVFLWSVVSSLIAWTACFF